MDYARAVTPAPVPLPRGPQGRICRIARASPWVLPPDLSLV